MSPSAAGDFAAGGFHLRAVRAILIVTVNVDDAISPGAAMSFLKSLFGRRAASEEAKAPDPAHAMDYKSFVITAAPFKNEGQFQTAGTIEKDIDGTRQVHKFLRADRHASFEDAVAFTLRKGCQIIDEQGDRVFR